MDPTSAKSDEIDLLKVGMTLWAKRNILILCTLGFFTLGVMFALAQTKIYQGRIQVHPLTDAELTGFNDWNQAILKVLPNIPNDTSNLDVDKSDSSQTATKQGLIGTKVTSEILFSKFISHFHRGQALNSSLSQHAEAVKNFKGDSVSRIELMAELRHNFKIIRDGFDGTSITFITSNKIEAIQILETMFNSISQTVKRDSLKTIASIIESEELSRQLELQKLDIEYEAYIRLYDFKKKRSLALMREQAGIARELNLGNPSDNDSLSLSPSGLINNNHRLDLFESNYFLQGYSAIEKQIDIVQMRDREFKALIIADVEDLILNRERLELQNTKGMLSPLAEATPFNDADFQIVQTNLNNIQFKPLTNGKLLVGMFTVVGLLLSALAIIIGSIYQSRTHATNAP